MECGIVWLFLAQTIQVLLLLFRFLEPPFDGWRFIMAAAAPLWPIAGIGMFLARPR